MPDTNHLRKLMFAKFREARITDADCRRDVQEEVTGKRSARDFGPADFEKVIAHLQRCLGEHNDPRAHVLRRPDPPPGDWATPDQAALIEDLCDQIPWDTGRQFGPANWAAATVLRAPSKALFRQRLRNVYDGSKPLSERVKVWACLPRMVAANLIRSLIDARTHYGKDAPHGSAQSGRS